MSSVTVLAAVIQHSLMCISLKKKGRLRLMYDYIVVFACKYSLFQSVGE